MPRQLVSIVLVNWNSRDDLSDCLLSLQAQTDRDFETIVVDNGSADDSIKLVREQFPWVVLVDARENLGFAEGCNRGIAVAKGEWVFTLNCDAVADPNLLELSRSLIAKAPANLGMIQCRIMFKQKPGHTNSTGVLVFKNGKAIDRDFDVPLRAVDGIEEIFCPSAGAALYRRSMLDEVHLPTGYFDRRFFMYYEDVDLGWRCRLAGWSAWYDPSLLVHHRFHGASSKRGSHFVTLQCHENRVRYLLKNASGSFLLRSVPRTMYEFVDGLRLGGLGFLTQFSNAARDGVKWRGTVQKLSKVQPQDIEKSWVSRGKM